MSRPGGILDDPAALAAADPEGILTHAGKLGAQLQEGFARGRGVSGLPSGSGVRAIVVCGMGGSGVAGDMLRSLFAGRLPVPILVSKGYELPEFCGRDTIVIASSFSGDTEETIEAFERALSHGCRVIVVSAGGELTRRSEEEAIPHVTVPSDVPVPRAALGYLASAPLGALDAMGLIPPVERDVERAARVLSEQANDLEPSRSTERNEAKILAAWLVGRTPIVWGSEGLAEAPALRWKTQFNENAKVPAFHALLPELDHNEIEGWSRGSGGSYGLVVLRHEGEHPRLGLRVEATLDAISEAGLDARQVRAGGSSPMEWLFSLVMMGDFVSAYLALATGVDPSPIPVLSGLKARLRA